MNLERSINNLYKRIDRLDSLNGDGNDSNHWKGREIIPLNDWIRLKGTPYALQYFPDYLDRSHTFLTESELKNDEQTRKWYSDYLDLMEYRMNPNYGRTKCFHCLLSPERDHPIFIGINRLVAKGLQKDENQGNPVARKDTSAVQIKNKQDLYQALTNRETFTSILDQGLDYILSDKRHSMIHLNSNNYRKTTEIKLRIIL